MTHHAANTNFRAAPAMTGFETMVAVAHWLFELFAIAAFIRLDVPEGIVNVAWFLSWVDAGGLGIAVWAASDEMDFNARQGKHSPGYIRAMTSNPMPNVLVAAISGGLLFSMMIAAAFAGFYVMACVFLCIAFGAVRVYLARLDYHASIGL